jgi:uncharacterized Fe-S radical SAM superfamily protein PflX
MRIQRQGMMRCYYVVAGSTGVICNPTLPPFENNSPRSKTMAFYQNLIVKSNVISCHTIDKRITEIVFSNDTSHEKRFHPHLLCPVHFGIRRQSPRSLCGRRAESHINAPRNFHGEKWRIRRRARWWAAAGSGTVFFSNCGLRLPLVYNTCGWERLEIVKKLDGVVDIYLPDFKYADGDMAAKYSAGAESYPQITQAALREMHRQVGLGNPRPTGSCTGP